MKKKRLWIVGVFAVAVFSLTSCATYQVAKEEVLPAVKDVVIAAGPHLLEALIEDLIGLISGSAETVEGVLPGNGDGA